MTTDEELAYVRGAMNAYIQSALYALEHALGYGQAGDEERSCLLKAYDEIRRSQGAQSAEQAEGREE